MTFWIGLGWNKWTHVYLRSRQLGRTYRRRSAGRSRRSEAWLSRGSVCRRGRRCSSGTTRWRGSAAGSWGWSRCRWTRHRWAPSDRILRTQTADVSITIANRASLIRPACIGLSIHKSSIYRRRPAGADRIAFSTGYLSDAVRVSRVTYSSSLPHSITHRICHWWKGFTILKIPFNGNSF